MIATIVWVGGLALMALVVWPSARAALGPGPELADLIRRLQRRFSPLAWGSLAVLIATGLTQMSANPNYDGFLRLTNAWTVAILAKHLAVGAMILIGLYMQMSFSPSWAGWRCWKATDMMCPRPNDCRRRELRSSPALNLACAASWCWA